MALDGWPVDTKGGGSVKVSIQRIGDEVQISLDDPANSKHFEKRIPLYQAELLGKMLATAGVSHEWGFKFNIEVSD